MTDCKKKDLRSILLSQREGLTLTRQLKTQNKGKKSVITKKGTGENGETSENIDPDSEQFAPCNHGDLIHDYVCCECVYSRWRQSLSKSGGSTSKCAQIRLGNSSLEISDKITITKVYREYMKKSDKFNHDSGKENKGCGFSVNSEKSSPDQGSEPTENSKETNPEEINERLMFRLPPGITCRRL